MKNMKGNEDVLDVTIFNRCESSAQNFEVFEQQEISKERICSWAKNLKLQKVTYKAKGDLQEDRYEIYIKDKVYADAKDQIMEYIDSSQIDLREEKHEG